MDAEAIVKHKFDEDTNLSYREVFDFAFRTFVLVWQALTRELGEERVLPVLEKLVSESATRAGHAAARQALASDSAAEDAFAAFHAYLRKPNHFWRHVLTYAIVEDTPQAFEVRVTECLWATTFRELGAAELGYVLICHPDFAYCQGFDPRIRLRRTKTLMQGECHCDHRWIWEP
jgi:hypothetical protein